MGVVARQTIKNNIIAYFGVGIGMVSQFFIYPLDLEFKGLLDVLIKYAQMLLPFLVLGMNGVMFKFLPYINNDREVAASQLFTRAVAIVSIGILCAALSNWLFLDLLILGLSTSSLSLANLGTYRWEILSMASAFSYATVITAHLTNFSRVAIPVVFNSLTLKIGLALIVLGVFTYGISHGVAILAMIMVTWVGVLGLILYAGYLKIFQFQWGRLNLKGASVREMYSLAAYGILGSVGSVLAVQLDTVMVNGFLGNQATGVYTFAVFAALVIAIPYKAINSITAPIVATALKDRDVKTIQRVYQQSSQVLFAAGGLVFTCTVVGLPYLYELTSRTGQYAIGYWATLFLGVGQLFDMLTSINAVILGQSKYYRWNLFFLLFMALFNVVFNVLFIVLLGWGLEGAAIATMLSLFLYNALKGFYLYAKMGVYPLSYSLLLTTLLLVTSGLISMWLPLPWINPYANVLIRCGLVLVIFLSYVKFTDGVPPIREALKGGMKKLFM